MKCMLYAGLFASIDLSFNWVGLSFNWGKFLGFRLCCSLLKFAIFQWVWGGYKCSA